MANRATIRFPSGWGLLQHARHRQTEGWDWGIEPVTVVRDHLVTPLHRTDRGLNDGSARISEALSRLQVRLFAHNAVAPDFLHLAVRVGNHPVARQQTRGGAAFVADGDGV